jgi:hypothetical protein
MQQDFRNAHDGDFFGMDDAILAGFLHSHTAKAGEDRAGKALAESGDDCGAIGVSGGFAGGEEDARIGVCGYC